MTQIIRAREVTRPAAPAPLKSSLLDHAAAAGNLVEMSEGFGLRNEAGMWPSYNCIDTLVPTPICPDPLLDGQQREPKRFQTAPWMPGFSFAVYGGVECSNIGLDVEDQKSELRRVFEANEGRGVESALVANRFVARAADPDDPMGVGWDAPEDITAEIVPADVNLSVKMALSLLEGYAATVYAGQPTIHMPRAAVSLLDVVKWDGDLAYTSLGSKIAMGGGYDVSTWDGTWTMYATGEVYVERSEQINVHSYVLPGDGSRERGLADNTSIALAERAYRVAVDCFVAQATGRAW